MEKIGVFPKKLYICVVEFVLFSEKLQKRGENSMKFNQILDTVSYQKMENSL